MFEFETSFQAAVRKLKSPTSVTFDPTALQSEYDQLTDPQPTDTSLLLAALWVAAQASALRRWPIDPDFEALDAATTVMLAVAAINREFLLIRAHANQSIEEARAEGALSFEHMTSRPLPEGSALQSMSADDALDAAVDAAESWLFDGYAKPNGIARDDLNLAPVAMRAMRRYSIQRGLNDIWNLCLWEGWRPRRVGGELLLMPVDMGFATRLEAGYIRLTQNFIKFIDCLEWRAMKPADRRARALPRTVVQVASGRRRKIRVGRPSCLSRKPPHFVLECVGLEGSYLKFLLDRQFPLEPQLTCRRLVQAWHVILDLAQAMIAAAGGTDGPPRKAAEKMALLISRVELVEILSEALTVDKSAADAAVSFLTFRVRTGSEKGHRGLWAAPLVPIPQSDDVALALPVLVASNPLRKVGAWLEKGGVDDSLSKDARGILYEVDYRKRICNAIAHNEMLQHATCADHAIKKDPQFCEQIDLLIRLGSLLIVGEVKCLLFPADPIERFNQLRKLKKAAEQANRKADALLMQPSVAAKALGLSEDLCKQLRVIPLVVTNQGFGFGLDFAGCLVADAAFLERYLTDGTFVVEAAIDTRTGETMPVNAIMYEREAQASERFEMEFSDPFVLRRFEQRIAWSKVSFPSPTGEEIFFGAPRLQDLSGDERVRAQVVTGILLRGKDLL